MLIRLLQHVGVQANVVDVATGKEQTTNDFRFTWCRDHGDLLSRKVVPRTYKGMLCCMCHKDCQLIVAQTTEAMLWLEGKRALQMGAEIRGIRTAP